MYTQLSRNQDMPLANRIDWMHQAACGLEYFASKRIVHGNIWSQELFVHSGNVIKVWCSRHSASVRVCECASVRVCIGNGGDQSSSSYAQSVASCILSHLTALDFFDLSLSLSTSRHLDLSTSRPLDLSLSDS